jgi:ribosomal protein S16
MKALLSRSPGVGRFSGTRSNAWRPLRFEPLEGRRLLSLSFGFALQVGDGSWNQGWGVASDADGNAYVAGHFEGTADFDPGPGTVDLTSAGGSDVFVAKYTAAGALVWARRMGGTGWDEGYEIAVAADGSVYATGYFYGAADFGGESLAGAGSYDGFVSKLDPNGTLAWVRGMGGAGFDAGGGIAVAGDGSVYTTGWFAGTADFGANTLAGAGGDDAFVAKLDAGGNFVWARPMGGASGDYGYDIAVDAGGNAYATGLFSGTADFGGESLTSAGDYDVFVVKVDSDGNVVWTRQMGGTGWDEGWDVAVGSDGAVYATGFFNGTADFGAESFTSAGSADIFVAKLDSDGNPVWTRQMGGTGDDQGWGIAVANDGNVYTAGHFQNTVDFDPGAASYLLTSFGGCDVFISRLDASGGSGQAWQMGGSNCSESGGGIAVAPDGSVYTTGTFRGSGDFDPGEGTFELPGTGDPNALLAFLARLDGEPVAISAPDLATFREKVLPTVGVYDPAAAEFYLRNSNDPGVADVRFGYGPAGLGWQPLAGDWDGDGIDTIGLYNPATRMFYLRNSNSAGANDARFAFGYSGPAWQPVVGDWDGDGIDTIGLYDPGTSTFYLKNTNANGPTAMSFSFGQRGVGLRALAGDWNGDGIDTIGVYDPATRRFFLRDSNSAGPNDARFAYGYSGPAWRPVVGDWNGDGTDTVGLYDPATSAFYLKNNNGNGPTAISFRFGQGGLGLQPVIGDWNGPEPSLLAVGGEADLEPIVARAIAAWGEAGVTPEQLAELAAVRFVIADLPGTQLGSAGLDAIYLDSSAAGHGWFIDPTPGANEEYAPGAAGILEAVDPAAVDRIDLLTVVAHELGHKLGLGGLDWSDGVMNDTLPAGRRREPGPAEIDALFAA